MAILDELKARMNEAMRGKDDVAKNIYRLAYSETQLASARSGKAVSEDEVIAILKKLVKSNEETLAVASDAVQKDALAREIALLAALLPKALDVPEIVAALAPVADAIRAAGNDGQATGVAMKQLKAAGASVDGKAVAAAVKQMRGG
ncbi:MAG: GatB/YqeY domain-containing protein [Polyangiaceae bacterium]